MKEYTALHYVRDHIGELHTPGEIFDSEYADAAEARLLRLGAVIVNGECTVASEDPADEHDEPSSPEDEADEESDVSEMIDVMEGISSAKTKKRGRRA